MEGQNNGGRLLRSVTPPKEGARSGTPPLPRSPPRSPPREKEEVEEAVVAAVSRCCQPEPEPEADTVLPAATSPMCLDGGRTLHVRNIAAAASVGARARRCCVRSFLTTARWWPPRSATAPTLTGWTRVGLWLRWSQLLLLGLRWVPL
eukprot:SAG25_NODE_29_length_20738_cov_25.829546_12_plen_148_part_00